MPQFVILRHESPQGVHFDFMIELAGVLKTWALPQPPDSAVEIPCEALADHRLAYLDYEGPISGGRGSVTRWDRGTCIVRQQSDTECVVELAGEKLTGEAIFRRDADDPNRWAFSLAKKPDQL
jgi:hypothetical protein